VLVQIRKIKVKMIKYTPRTVGHRLASTAVIALVVALFTGCSQVEPISQESKPGRCGEQVNSESLQTIRVSGGVTVEGPAVQWGIKEQCFAQAGLEVDYQPLRTIEAAAALSSGSLDVIGLTVADFLTYVANGSFDGKIIGSSSGYLMESLQRARIAPLYPGELLIQVTVLVPGDSDIKSFQDLSGSRIAASGRDELTGWAILDAINATGGDSATVEILSVPTESRLGALERGDVDAIMLAGRYAEDAMSQGLRLVGYPGAYFYEEGPVTIWVTSPKVLSEKPELVSKFKAAITSVNTQLRDLEANQESYRQILVEKFDIAPEVAENTKVPNFWLEQVTLPQLSEMAQKLIRLGAIKAIPNLESLIVN
jgi:ABC-type taurine transport system substrate-binding protein